MKQKSIKEKLSSLDDIELYNVINAVCLASGLDESKTKNLTGNIPRLRKMLASLDEKQINTLLASLGRSGENEIAEMIRRL